MRDLWDKKELNLRLKGQRTIHDKEHNNKNHDKHIQQIRNGTLPFWKDWEQGQQERS
jgi:hypothetical protein